MNDRDLARTMVGLTARVASRTFGHKRAKFVEQAADGMFVFDVRGQQISVSPGANEAPGEGAWSTLVRVGDRWEFANPSGYASGQ